MKIKEIMTFLLIVLLCTCISGCVESVKSHSNKLSIVDDINLFSFKLLKACKSKGNQFISPISIEFALAPIADGAGGNTKTEILKALCLPSNDSVRRHDFANLYERLNTSKNLTIANALWIQKEYPIKRKYMENVKYYHAEIHYVNFESERAAREINEWISKETNGKIDKIVSRINPLTKLAVTNAMFFSGKWKYMFEETSMKFYSPESVNRVKAIVSISRYNYTNYSGVEAVEIPYANKNYSMIIVMTNNISLEIFKKLANNMKTKLIKLYIPELEIKKGYDLEKPLSKLGIKVAFTPKANFSGISNMKLYIGCAKHKTYLKIDKNGTVAAAATYIGVIATAIPQNYKVVKINRPFYIFIVRNMGKKKLILFSGRIVTVT
jgi:serpin B